MSTVLHADHHGTGLSGRLRQGEAWLDRKGKVGWIIAIVASFILFWPLGLALLAYAIWSNRMFNRACRMERHHHRDHRFSRGQGSSGNSAFDAYRAEALRRLEDEQAAFEAFIQRLREAKDKAQFDTFMEDRARQNRDAETDADPAATPAADSKGSAANTDEGRSGAY
jgi:hypothetical protein